MLVLAKGFSILSLFLVFDMLTEVEDDGKLGSPWVDHDGKGKRKYMD